MRHKGPIFTLLAGLALAAVLMVLNLTATNRNRNNGDNAANAGANATATTTSELGTAPTTAPATAAPTKAPPAAQVTYAGRVSGGGATIAIAIKDGKAVAYLCDGNRAEAWLQGTASNGELKLAGSGNATLTGSYGNGVAAGAISATGKKWTFAVGTVKAPSGLYRAAANVRNARIVGGWIVLASGEQVGVLNVAGEEQPAPPLNTATNTTTVDGTVITANPVDGTGL